MTSGLEAARAAGDDQVCKYYHYKDLLGAWEGILPERFSMSDRQVHLYNTPGGQLPDGTPVDLHKVPGSEFDPALWGTVSINHVVAPVPRTRLLNQPPKDRVRVSDFDVEKNESKLMETEWTHGRCLGCIGGAVKEFSFVFCQALCAGHCLHHYSDVARLAPTRWLPLKQADWTNWDVNYFPQFAASIARVIGGVTEDSIIGGPPDEDFDWEHWFGHVKVEAGLRFWLQQYKPSPDKAAGFPEGAFTGQHKSEYYSFEKQRLLPGGGRINTWFNPQSPGVASDIQTDSALVEQAQQELVSRVAKCTSIVTDKLKNIQANYHYFDSRTSDETAVLLRLVHHLYIVMQDRTNKAMAWVCMIE